MIKLNFQKNLFGQSGEMLLDINLNLKEGEFVAISGDSGSGKTTILRILAGLEKATGDIKVGDEVWLDKKTFLPPQKRKIGFVFQNYALFTNMSVEENLLFVKKDKKLANKLLEMTNLTNLKDAYPNKLSGGQSQRVSLCRAFMNSPKILLLDEAFSALDAKMRDRLQKEVLILHKEFKTTTLMVSHDKNEILKMADRIVTIENGKVLEDKDIGAVFENSSDVIELEGEVVRVDEKKVYILVENQILMIEKSRDFRVGEWVKMPLKVV